MRAIFTIKLSLTSKSTPKFWAAPLCALALGVAVSTNSGATELAGRLSAKEIKTAGKILGMGSIHRPWTAGANESDEGLGMSLGIESTFIYRGNVGTMGDGRAVAPRIVPVPRLWTSWELPADFQISGSLAPGMAFDGIAAVGGAVQWTIIRDADTRSAFSTLLGYTYSDAFGDLRTYTTEMGVEISRDLELWQPYAGASFLVGNTTVKHNRQMGGVEPGPYTIPSYHAFIGANLISSGRFSFQLDLIANKFSAALLIANRF